MRSACDQSAAVPASRSAWRGDGLLAVCAGSVLMISIAIAAAAAAWRRATSSGGRPMSASIMAAPSRTAAAIRGAKSPEVGIGREHAVCELAKFAVFGFGLAGEQPTAGSATPHMSAA